MEDIFLTSLLPLRKSTTASFSTMTELYASRLHYAKTSYSLTLMSSGTCEYNFLMPEVKIWGHKCKQMWDGDLQSSLVTPVCGRTKVSVPPPWNTASTNMSVPTAAALTTSTMPAPTNQKWVWIALKNYYIII
jgi:hypothetical protein